MPQTIRVALEGNGSITIYQNPNPGVLSFGSRVPITLSGFPSSAKIASIDVYQNAIVNGLDSKGTKIGTWYASSPSNQPEDEIVFSVDGNGIVSIEDNDTDTDTKLWYGLTVQGYPPVDPELIVKKQE